MALTKIGSIGINTGIQFAGVTTIATLNASDNVLSVGGTVNFVSDVSIGGTVSIAGTLTYEDVTNVDSVGLITARNGIKVGSGITLSSDGNIFATGVTTSTTFVGDLTGTASGNATISSNADNRVITGGSGNALVGESGLTYNTQTLRLNNTSVNPQFHLTSANNGISELKFGDQSDTTRAVILYRSGSAGDALCFNGYNNTERLRIASDGKIGINTTTADCILHVVKAVAGNMSADTNAVLALENSNHCVLNMMSPADKSSYIMMGDPDDINAGQIRYDNNTNALLIDVNSEERVRIDAGGRLLVGHTANISAGGHDSMFLLTGDTYMQHTGTILANENTARGAMLQFAKQRSGSAGGTTIVQDGDNVGQIRFIACDGVDLNSRCADISAQIDGAPGSNDTPGRLIFSTTPDGSDNAVERLRITSTGEVKIAEAAAGQTVLSVIGGYSSSGTVDIATFARSGSAVKSAIRYNDATTDMSFGTTTSHGLNLMAGGSTHMTVKTAGHVLFNQTSTHVPGLANTTVGASMEDIGSQGSALFVSRGDSISLFLNRNNAGQIVSFRQSGNEVGSISTNGNSLPSDRNFKKNITDLTLGLDFVNTLKPSKFNLKLEEDTDPLSYGLIAQDVEESLTAAGISKNSVTLLKHDPKESESESDYNLDYGKLIPVLINAIKELSTKVAALEG